MTSSRFASFIQEVNADDLLRLPLPQRSIALDTILNPSKADEEVRKAFSFKAPEWALVEDAFSHTLSVFQAANPSRRRSVPDKSHAGGRDFAEAKLLQDYGDAYGQVIRARFGPDKHIHTTVFRTAQTSPIHLVAVHLGWPGGAGVEFQDVTTSELLAQMASLAKAVESRSVDGGTIRRRVARIYSTTIVGQKKVPTIYLCKPSLARYWTRSMGMRDADDVSADLLLLGSSGRRIRGREASA